MRPVNLIPPEQRYGSQSPLRTGPLPYVLVGALALAVLGVSLLALTGNEIAERKDEVATLKREDAAAQAHARRLDAYVQFAEMREARLATISSLADSRFDWERVMRELSKILPADVWLTNLEASASGGTEGETAGVAGPSLQISGCAHGQEGVAGFITALKEIDGVTRVGMESSSVSSQEGGGGSTSEGCGAGSSAQFQMTVAFDAAPLPPSEEEGEAATLEATAPESTESTESATTTASTEG